MPQLIRLGLVLTLCSIVSSHAASGGELGKAVIERLGKVEPSPAPSPEPEDRIRLITSFTMQNKPTGDSIITFEAVDYGHNEKDHYRVIAIEQYSLIEPKEEARELRDEIVRKLRALEADLLAFVDMSGGPREPQKVFEMGGAGSAQPYR
jgi:hypothetical protein